MKDAWITPLRFNERRLDVTFRVLQEEKIEVLHIEPIDGIPMNAEEKARAANSMKTIDDVASDLWHSIEVDISQLTDCYVGGV